MVSRNAEIKLKPGKNRATLAITHPNAAGIEIGSALSMHQDLRWQDDEWQRSNAVPTVPPKRCVSAAALRTSQSALGVYFRRICSRMDKPKAATAAVHKLARLICTMLIKGEEYTDQGQAYCE